MRTVGSKVLMDNLGKYLRTVRGGKTILVMGKDKVIAEIRQPLESRRRRVTLATADTMPS
jgi:antitoxin (DNA-binding transcriptional repressor) of toxin-antitoxin stability system